MSYFEMDQFDKKCLEKDIDQLNYSETEKRINNMSPIDYDLSRFNEYCEKNNIPIKKEKQNNWFINFNDNNNFDNNNFVNNNFDNKDIINDNQIIIPDISLIDIYEEIDELDINYNDDIELKNIDY